MGEQINVTLQGPLVGHKVRTAASIVRMAVKASKTHTFHIKHLRSGGMSLSLNSKD